MVWGNVLRFINIKGEKEGRMILSLPPPPFSFFCALDSLYLSIVETLYLKLTPSHIVYVIVVYVILSCVGYVCLYYLVRVCIFSSSLTSFDIAECALLSFIDLISLRSFDPSGPLTRLGLASFTFFFVSFLTGEEGKATRIAPEGRSAVWPLTCVKAAATLVDILPVV